MTNRPVVTPEEPPVGVCGKCRSNCVFERNEYYPDLLASECCGWSPLSLPEEAPE